MAKSNIRSFRYSDEVAEIIEHFQGNNLNDKFENLVLYCFWNRKQLDAEISDKQRELRRLEKQVEAAKAELFKVQRLMDVENELSASIAKVTMEAMNYLEQMKSVTQITPDGQLPAQKDCVTGKKGGRKVG